MSWSADQHAARSDDLSTVMMYKDAVSNLSTLSEVTESQRCSGKGQRWSHTPTQSLTLHSEGWRRPT